MAIENNNGVNGKPIAPTIIRTRGLCKDFEVGDQWVHALNTVDLDIPQGQFTTIMGPSGSGKSTLLYMIGGLDRPTEGEIVVAGNRLDTLTGEELAAFRRETVGFIFQAFHLVPTLTALENVALPGIFAGLERDARENRAFKILAALGMDDRIDHRPNQLSGGQQQRVAIARALFNDPPIIMADEPTGALDSKTGQTVMKLLRYLCRQQGKTIIVVTHDAAVANYAERMIGLHDGYVIEDRAMREAPSKPAPMINGWDVVEDAIVEEADYVE
jgi:putative ABC transport system ATP-binding protein